MNRKQILLTNRVQGSYYIWTPGTNPLAGLDPQGTRADLADLDPLRGLGPPYYSSFIQLFIDTELEFGSGKLQEKI